jgi:hypothetical protein
VLTPRFAYRLGRMAVAHGRDRGNWTRQTDKNAPGQWETVLERVEKIIGAGALRRRPRSPAPRRMPSAPTRRPPPQHESGGPPVRTSPLTFLRARANAALPR